MRQQCAFCNAWYDLSKQLAVCPHMFVVTQDLAPEPPLSPIVSAIIRERQHQDWKHGTIQEHPHSVAEWLLIMEKELTEAKEAWIKHGNPGAQRELLQVVATGVACMEQHGVVERSSRVFENDVDGNPRR